MLDVKTPLSKIQRATRRIDQSTTFFVPGQWGYIDSGKIKNIASTSTNQAQPGVLKCVMGNASTNMYESNDIEVGSIATLETVFRAAVDSNGYQILNCNTSPAAITYNPGDDLTVAYHITTAGTTSLFFAAAADIGKLAPAASGDIVVARVEANDSTNHVLTFETVTPHLKA